MNAFSNKSQIMWVLVASIALIAVGGVSGMAAPLPKTPMVPNNFSELAQKARPGVVNIRTVKTIKGGGRVFRHFYGDPFGGKRNPFDDFFGPFMENGPQQEFKQRSLGSGFILDQEGYIVTNNHVIEDADEIVVRLANEKEFKAKVVGRDSKTDLALIKIQDAKDLTPLEMGDSDKLQVGTWVVAIGSPFGLEQTVTAGIVSAKGRIIGSGPYDEFIQTDASINPGNSGGPLLNMEGQVVGINTAIIASGQGIGFAIPINLAKGIVTQLKEGGEVVRGWLGVGIQDLTDELADYYGLKDQKGVLVTQVFKDDPADKAGIRPNDIITAIDGQSVTTGRELSKIVANTAVGKKTRIDYLRDGKAKSVTVTLAKRVEDEQQITRPVSEEGDEIGIRVKDLSAEIAKQFGLGEEDAGVLITQVKDGGKADAAGIAAGDIIKEVNHKAVGNVAEYAEVMKSAKKGEELSMLLKRRNSGYIAVKIVP
jgi:serine protease Do